MNKYTSILFCFHEHHTDIYKEGIPHGQIINDKYEPYVKITDAGLRIENKLDQESVDKVLSVLSHIKEATQKPE